MKLNLFVLLSTRLQEGLSQAGTPPVFSADRIPLDHFCAACMCSFWACGSHVLWASMGRQSHAHISYRMYHLLRAYFVWRTFAGGECLECSKSMVVPKLYVCITSNVGKVVYLFQFCNCLASIEW